MDRSESIINHIQRRLRERFDIHANRGSLSNLRKAIQTTGYRFGCWTAYPIGRLSNRESAFIAHYEKKPRLGASIYGTKREKMVVIYDRQRKLVVTALSYGVTVKGTNCVYKLVNDEYWAKS